jgi:hypothetical protein
MEVFFILGLPYEQEMNLLSHLWNTPSMGDGERRGCHWLHRHLEYSIATRDSQEAGCVRCVSKDRNRRKDADRVRQLSHRHHRNEEGYERRRILYL